jgi:hypothetical protein
MAARSTARELGLMKYWLLLLLAACDSGSPSPYGNKPHLLGRAGVLSVHDKHTEARQKFPQLDGDTGVGQFHDGTTDYRVFFTESGRVESILVYEPGKLSDLEAGWGRGTRGEFAGGPANFYFDAAAVYIAFSGEPGQFVVEARPYLPLEKIWDEGHDVRVFGIDLLGKPLTDDLAALAALGIDGTTQPDGDKQVTRNDGAITSDAGTVEWSLESNANGRVTMIAVRIGPYDVPSNVPAMDALFVEKWGKPTFDRVLHFPVDQHQIVEFPDKDIHVTE